MKKSIGLSAWVVFAAFQALAGTITITQPDGGSFALDAVCPIHWQAERVNRDVKIQLIRPGGGLVGLLASRLAPGSSPYNWTVAGPAVAGESYRVRVSAVDGSVTAESAAFSITAGRPRCDLELNGAGVEYRRGRVVAWVKNNGPDALPATDIRFRLDFPETGAAGRELIRRDAFAVGAVRELQLMDLPAASIPNGGLLTAVRIDTEGSGIADGNPQNQQRNKRLCLLDIRCELRPADLVLTIADTPNGHEYRLRFKVRVRHNLDRAVENIIVTYGVHASHGPLRDSGGNSIIASLAPGREWVQQVDQTFGELGWPNARRPRIRPGSDFSASASISDMKAKFCDIQYDNNSSTLDFQTPD